MNVTDILTAYACALTMAIGVIFLAHVRYETLVSGEGISPILTHSGETSDYT